METTIHEVFARYRSMRTDPPRVWVVAEIGINHEGSVDLCAQMIEQAARAGADAIKLQTIDPDENYVAGTESYRVFKGSELSRDETARMFELARRLGMEAFTTAGDFKTLEWVEKLEPCAHKISSGLLTHLPLIRQASRYYRPVLISSGMASVEEIDTAVRTVRGEGNEQVGLFQCTSRYPAPAGTLNLAAIEWMRQRWDLPVGFSDHSTGNNASFLAVGAGAVMVEKHFSFDIWRPGYDHRISVDEAGLGGLIENVRLAEKMMGYAEKELPSDMDGARERNLRCLVARCNIAPGETFSETNVAVKRPLPERRGLYPGRYGQVLGRKAREGLSVDDPITESSVEWEM